MLRDFVVGVVVTLIALAAAGYAALRTGTILRMPMQSRAVSSDTSPTPHCGRRYRMRRRNTQIRYP